jgi:hypothetical protein
MVGSINVSKLGQFTLHAAVEQQSDTATRVIVLDWNDHCENSLRNSRIATISTIPIVMTACIKKMPLDDSFYGFRAERP